MDNDPFLDDLQIYRSYFEHSDSPLNDRRILGQSLDMVFQKGQVHENSCRIEPHLASQNLHLCGFQNPQTKKQKS